MTDLVFSDLPIAGSPTPLVFGGGDFAIPATLVDAAFTLGGVTVNALMVPPIEVNIAFALGGVEVAAEVRVPVAVEAAFTLGSVTVSSAVFYDNRVTPWLDSRVMSPTGQGTSFKSLSESAWDVADVYRDVNNSAWQPANHGAVNADTLHQSASAKRSGVDALWQPADKNLRASESVHQKAVFVTKLRSDNFTGADRRIDESESGMQAGIFKAPPKVGKYQTADHARRTYDALVGASLYRAGKQFTDGLFQMAGSPLPGFDPFEPPPPLPATWDANLVFQCPVLGYPALVFGALPCYDVVAPPGVTVVVQIQRVYIVINDATLRRVDGNIALPTFGMSLSLDVDSWTWGFSASLPADTLASLEPASTGAPVEVEAMVNGVAYRALVETISRSRSFGKSAITIQGRGKTALLDVPYSPVSNFTNSVDRTAQQLMGDVLSVNGVPMSWAVTWGLTDWLVPAGVFAHQGSYIGALGRIAESVGGYLQPHASTQSISVLPRYPSTPWGWGSVTPDFELPSAVTTTEGISWLEKARYNRVFVSGVQQGVLGQVTRTGTAGDLLAPMITDALITHADAARQRGLSILANTGRQANVTLKLPVLAETGIITPGKFVRYVDGATTRTGIVRSVGVEVASPEIFQTLGIETHVN